MASSGGDVNGGNLRTRFYTANSLNQYTSILTPGFEDICGAAIATNSVTVNSLAPDRKGEYFHREMIELVRANHSTRGASEN